MIALGFRNIICKVKKKREGEREREKGKVCSFFDRESVRVCVHICVCVCVFVEELVGDNKKIVRTR